MNKKLFIFAFAVMLGAIVAGCGSSGADDSAKNEPQPKTGQFEGADDKADSSTGVTAKGGSESTASEL